MTVKNVKPGKMAANGHARPLQSPAYVFEICRPYKEKTYGHVFQKLSTR